MEIRVGWPEAQPFGIVRRIVPSADFMLLSAEQRPRLPSMSSGRSLHSLRPDVEFLAAPRRKPPRTPVCRRRRRGSGTDPPERNPGQRT